MTADKDAIATLLLSHGNSQCELSFAIVILIPHQFLCRATIICENLMKAAEKL